MVYQECFNALGNNPTYDPSFAYCQRISRDPTSGLWIATEASFENLGLIDTPGELRIDARSGDEPGIGGDTGAVFANVLFNYLIEYEVQNNPGGPVFDYADTIGSTIFNPPYGAQFRWKLNTTLGYDFGPGALSVNWRHTPRTRHVAKATNPAAE